MHLKKFTSAAVTACLLLTNSAPALAFPVDFAPGTQLVDALRALGYKSGKNIVINGDLKGSVAMHMDDTTFDGALKALSLAHNFSFEEVDNTVLIAPQKSMNSVETFKLKHLEPELAAKQFALLVDSDDVVVNNDLHSITVSGSTATLSRIRNQIEQLDVAQQQVNIKATVVELNKSKTRQMGLSYLSDPWTKNTSVSGYNGFSFSISGSHEETIGKGNVLARPNVTVFDGRKASILMGDKVPVFTSSSDSTDTDADTTMTVEYKEVGVKLEVVPRINDMDKETITMVIKPSVSTISEWVESGNNKAPQISERSAETTIRVKSGETILLGGLLKNEEIKSIKQIPFLSKIPILGEIFKSRSIDKQDSEIVIAITPTIVYDADGRPQVEMQKLKPTLHEKLNELQSEKEELNIGSEAQKAVDSENAILKADRKRLESELANKEDTISSKDDLIRKLKNENDKIKKEIKKSNELMKKILSSEVDENG